VRWPKDWLRALFEEPRRLEPEIEVRRRETTTDDMKSAYSAILAILHARQRRDFADLEAQTLSADRRMGHFHHVSLFLAEPRAIGAGRRSRACTGRTRMPSSRPRILRAPSRPTTSSGWRRRLT